MKNLYCKNTIIDKHGATRDCNRLLASIADSLYDSMANNENQSIVLRCPSCDKKTGWQKFSGKNGHTLEVVSGGVFAETICCETVKSEQIG